LNSRGAWCGDISKDYELKSSAGPRFAPALAATGMTLALAGSMSGFFGRKRTMKDVPLPLPELGLIAGKRVAFGDRLGLTELVIAAGLLWLTVLSPLSLADDWL
jgi:hypothetical protein